MKEITCSILQPHFLPWVGYFNLMLRSDIFIFLDDVEFTIGEWKNRNKIRKTYNSQDTKWLTVPVRSKNHFSLLNECEIADENNWRERNINSIFESYKKTPYFDKYFEDIKNIILDKNITILSKININLIHLMCKLLKIETKTFLSSELNSKGDKHHKPMNICKEINANKYLTTNKSSDYIKIEEYKSNNILIEFQNFIHPSYNQYFNGKKLESIKYLSIIDLLFNQGPESLKYIN